MGSLISYLGTLAVVAVGVVLTYLGTMIAAYYYAYYRMQHLPQVPSAQPLFGHFNEIVKLGSVGALLAKYSQQMTSFAFWIGPRAIFATADPRLVADITIKHSRDKCPDRGLMPLNPFVIGAYGRDAHVASQMLLMCREAGTVKGIRAAMAPMFSSEGLVELLPHLVQTATKAASILLQLGNSGQEVDVTQVLGKFALQNILLASLGVNVDVMGLAPQNTATTEPSSAQGKFLGAVRTIFETLVVNFTATKMTAMLPLRVQPVTSIVPFQVAALFKRTAEHRLCADRAYIVDTALAMVNRTHRDNGRAIKYHVPDSYAVGTPVDGSLISRLARTRNSQTKLPFDDLLVAGNAAVSILAGYDTTSNALAFTAYLLARHPACQDRAAQECAGFQHDKLTSLEDVTAALPYTYACFNEALRIYPPAPLSLRLAKQNMQLGDYLIPQGTTLMLNIAGMHSNPAYFADPTQFNPERFLPDNPEMQARPQHAFLPFGAGARNCVGWKFAVLESLVFLALVLPKVRLGIDESRKNQELETYTTITQGPKNGVWLRTSPRS